MKKELEEIQQLKKRVEELKLEYAKAQERKTRAEADLDGILADIKAKAKCEPSELDAKIAELEAEMEKEADAIKEKLGEAEAMKDDGSSDESAPDEDAFGEI